MGRPLLYGTTPGFLEQFALRHLAELPRADELAVALRDPDSAAHSAGRDGPPATNGAQGEDRTDSAHASTRH